MNIKSSERHLCSVLNICWSIYLLIYGSCIVGSVIFSDKYKIHQGNFRLISGGNQGKIREIENENLVGSLSQTHAIRRSDAQCGKNKFMNIAAVRKFMFRIIFMTSELYFRLYEIMDVHPINILAIMLYWLSANECYLEWKMPSKYNMLFINDDTWNAK